jgi:hypothetical protein
MNKKLLISLFSLIILLLIALAISISFNRNRPTTIVIPAFNTNIRGFPGPLKLSMNGTATTSDNFGCADNLVPIALANPNGPAKIFCVEDQTRKNLDNNIYDLYGYYSTYDRVVYPLDYDPQLDPPPTTIMCPQITVASGTNPLLVKYEVSLEKEGLKYFNDRGLPTFGIANVNMQKLTDAQKLMLIQSSADAPVYMSIQEAPAGESGCEMQCCHGFMNILSVHK